MFSIAQGAEQPVCVREQRRSATARTLPDMRLVSIKAALAAIWVSGACIAGIVGDLNSLSSWALLAGVAALPPLVMMWRWNDPRQTMSESIQDARK